MELLTHFLRISHDIDIKTFLSGEFPLLEWSKMISLEKENNLDRILGTPSAQNIIRTLACWERLPVRALIEKTHLSESQIHATLKNLIQIGIVTSPSRGYYQFAQTEVVRKIQEAYTSILIQAVGEELYKIMKTTNEYTPEDLTAILGKLQEKWGPIIQNHYSRMFSSLVETMIDQI
jgi:predicted transcriptional regulator